MDKKSGVKKGPGCRRPGKAVAPVSHEGAGFTLIELLVAVAILAVLIVAIYTTLFNVLGTREVVEAQMDRLHAFRRFSALFEKEVRSSYMKSSDPRTLWQGRGGEDTSRPMGSLSFTYYAYPAGRSPSGDLEAVSYTAEDTPDRGITLFRQTWNPYTGQRSVRAEVMEDIEGLDISFYDGEHWVKTWDGVEHKGPPLAVRLSIGIKALEGVNRLTATVLTMIR